jgi:CHAT domain-containing protein
MAWKRYHIFFLLPVFWVLSGCAAAVLSSADRDIASGRYAAVEKEKSGTAKDLSDAKSEEIIDLCYAYWKQKKYNALFSCLDRLEANIAAGDATVFRYTPFNVSRRSSTSYPQNITVLPLLIRAETAVDFGDYTKAIRYAEKALPLIETIKWEGVDGLTNWPNRLRIRALGVIALAQALAGERRQASETLARLEAAPVGFVAMLPVKKERNQQLGRAYMALGEYRKLLEFKTPFLDAIGSFAETFILGTYLTGDNLFAFVNLPIDFMFGKALQETGRIEEARNGYDKLLSHPAVSQNGDIYGVLLFERGRIAEAEKNPEAALEFYRKAVEVIEQQRSTIHTEASKIGFVGDKQLVYFRLIAALVDLGRHDTAFEYAERAKSRALVDLLASNDRPLGDRPGIVRMTAELDRFEALSKAQGGGSDARIAGARSIEIREKIRTSAPELYSLIAVSTPSARDLQAMLASDETLLEYYASKEDLFVFVVTPGRVSAYRLDGKSLTEQVSAFRKALGRPDGLDVAEMSAVLYRRLIQPVEKEIVTPYLVVVPHGALHRLPFSVLSNGNETLLEKFSISYLPSCSVLRFIRDGRAARLESALVFGNPDLGDPGFDLENAEKEAIRVGRSFPKARVLLRKEATESEFKMLADRYGTVHFACHASFSPDVPLNSGLLLRKDDRNDGLLTAGELYAIRMDADLVTLSACETGVGDIRSGDDVIGLTRGFLYAGTRSILASLWQVDDEATAELMTSFYGHLAGGDKRKALGEAQLEVRRKKPHPYYWAAFELIGRAR